MATKVDSIIVSIMLAHDDSFRHGADELNRIKESIKKFSYVSRDDFTCFFRRSTVHNSVASVEISDTYGKLLDKHGLNDFMKVMKKSFASLYPDAFIKIRFMVEETFNAPKEES